MVKKMFRLFTKTSSRSGEAEAHALRAELAECRRQNEKLRQEFALERERSVREAAVAAERALEMLMQQSATPLANLGAMQARHEAQGDVAPADIFRVAASLEQLLCDRGLERIGTAGMEAPFDAALHQMLDGASPQPGEPVLVRFSGYRCKGKLLSKARASLPGKQAKE